MTAAALRHDALIVACAISAGIHAALAPAHFAESTGAGVGFAVAALALAGLAVSLTRAPDSRVALAAVLAAFAGLLVSYALAVTAGLPLLHPDPEPVDGLALATKAIEATGLVLTLHILRHLKGTLT